MGLRQRRYHWRQKGEKGYRSPPILAAPLIPCLPTRSQCPVDIVPSPIDLHATGVRRCLKHHGDAMLQKGVLQPPLQGDTLTHWHFLGQLWTPGEHRAISTHQQNTSRQAHLGHLSCLSCGISP